MDRRAMFEQQDENGHMNIYMGLVSGAQVAFRGVARIDTEPRDEHNPQGFDYVIRLNSSQKWDAAGNEREVYRMPVEQVLWRTDNPKEANRLAGRVDFHRGNWFADGAV